MFAFLTRKKATGLVAGAEAAAGTLAEAARQKRLFDRTAMSPDIAVPVPGALALGKPLWRETFGLKPAIDAPEA